MRCPTHLVEMYTVEVPDEDGDIQIVTRERPREMLCERSQPNGPVTHRTCTFPGCTWEVWT